MEEIGWAVLFLTPCAAMDIGCKRIGAAVLLAGAAGAGGGAAAPGGGGGGRLGPPLGVWGGLGPLSPPL